MTAAARENIKSTSDIMSSEQKQGPFHITPDRWYNNNITSVFDTGHFSDCKITLKDRIFKGHTMILAGACAFFEKALCGDFKESQDKQIDLSDEDPEVAMSMLKYIYGYGYESINNSEEASELMLDVRLYVMADRYNYKPLKDAAREHLMAKIPTTKLQFSLLLSILAEIHDTAPPDDSLLPSAASRIVEANIGSIRSMTAEELGTLSHELPRLCYDALMAKESASGPIPVNKRCSSCQAVFAHRGNARYCSGCGQKPYNGFHDIPAISNWTCKSCGILFGANSPQACPVCRHNQFTPEESK